MELMNLICFKPRRSWRQLCVTIVLTSTGLIHQSAHAASPVGSYGGANPIWEAQYSQDFFDCLNSDPKTAAIVLGAIQSKQLSDVGTGRAWCPSADLTSSSNAKLFLLSVFEALAQKESNYYPTITAKGPYGTVVGLFQIGDGDAKLHQCKSKSGNAITSVAALQIPANNICCALQTMAWEATQNPNVQKTVFATGNTGIMSSFWQPMRQGSSTAKSNDIKAKVAQACDAIASNNPSRDFTSREIASAGGQWPDIGFGSAYKEPSSGFTLAAESTDGSEVAEIGQ